MRLHENPLLRSLAILALVYGLLAAPWPGLGRAFVTVYAVAAEATLREALPDGTSFRASQPDEASGPWDLAIRLPPAPGTTTVHGIRVHLRRVAYVPLAFLAALAVAFRPGRSARRGSLVACPFVLVALQVTALLSVFTTRGILDLGTAGNIVVGLVSRAFFEAPGMAFAIPGLLWLLLARPLERVRGPGSGWLRPGRSGQPEGEASTVQG
jgi:hypothetical protein